MIFIGHHGTPSQYRKILKVKGIVVDSVLEVGIDLKMVDQMLESK